MGNKPYEWLIVLDNNGQELYRQEITDKGLERNDVQNVYPYIEGANKSGFQIVIPTQENMLHKVVKIINRLTDDSAGNGNYIDYIYYVADTIISTLHILCNPNNHTNNHY